MAMETTERRPFLDRLQQSVGIGAQVAGVMQQGQQIAQRGRELDIMKDEAQRRAEYFKVQAEQMKFSMERQQEELKDQSDQQFTKRAFQAALEFSGNPQDLKNYYSVHAKDLATLAERSGRPMSGEQLEDLFVKRSTTFGKFVPDVQTGLQSMASSFLPTGGVDRKKFNEGLNIFDQAFYKIASIAPELSEGVLQKTRDSYLKRIQNIDSEEAKTERDANKPVKPGRNFGLELALHEGKTLADQVAKGQEAQINSQRRLSNLDKIEGMLGQVKTGPLVNAGNLTKWREILGVDQDATVDLQTLRFYVANELGETVRQYIAETGARSADSDAELENLRKMALGMDMTPETMQRVITGMRELSGYANFVLGLKTDHLDRMKADPEYTKSFRTPSFKDYQNRGTAPQGQVPRSSLQPVDVGDAPTSAQQPMQGEKAKKAILDSLGVKPK